MDTIILIGKMLLVILLMVVVCFFTSGIDWGITGSIFERKSTPAQRAAREATKQSEERGTVLGGRKQSA
jgi:hypothetical protein